MKRNGIRNDDAFAPFKSNAHYQNSYFIKRIKEKYGICKMYCNIYIQNLKDFPFLSTFSCHLLMKTQSICVSNEYNCQNNVAVQAIRSVL